jgi:hypothetical protein
MKRLENIWVAAAIMAACALVIGLILVRRASDPRIQLAPPTNQPTTQGWKMKEEIDAEFAVKSEVKPATAPATAPVGFDSDTHLLPTD